MGVGSLLLVLTLPWPCHAKPQIVVEIAPAADQWVDARFTRRLIQIELDDVKSISEQNDDALFYRVLDAENDSLLIELWDRGRALGSRRISVSRGNARLHSRRIALAAAELARNASQKRRAWRRDDELKEADCQDARSARTAFRRQPRFSASTAATAAWLPAAQSWLTGIAVEPRLELAGGGYAGLRLSGNLGKLGVAAANPPLGWYEVAVVPGYRTTFGPDFRLELGLPLAAGLVDVQGDATVDGLAGESTSWSARIALDAQLKVRVSPGLWVGLGPEFGYLLRRVPIDDALRRRADFEGPWLGARLTFGVSAWP